MGQKIEATNETRAEEVRQILFEAAWVQYYSKPQDGLMVR